MMPELSHVEVFENLNFWVTTDKVCGVGFEVAGCDLEVEDSEAYGLRLTHVLRQLDSRILGRLKLETFTSNDLTEDFPRANAVNSLGFALKRIFLYLDHVEGFHGLRELKELFRKPTDSLNLQFRALLKAKESFEQFGFRLRPLSREASEQLFAKGPSAWRTTARSIETGTASIGVARVLKQPTEVFSEAEWLDVVDSLPKPYALNLSFQRMSEAKAKLLLARKLKQSNSTNDISARAQGSATENLILKSFETGSQFFEIEVLMTFERASEEQLSQALAIAASKMSVFSECFIETFGIGASFCATRPGNQQHVTLVEADDAVAVLAPLWVRGNTNNFDEARPVRSLTLNREDNSLFHFDLFNPAYSVFNTLIVGTSGKGKSVLTGLLTASLLNDPNIKIIKLDVGGSHSKECELFGGEELELRLDRASGINPFEVLSTGASENDQLGILSKFLGALIQEQGEIVLSKSLRSEIESCIREYIEAKRPVPTLSDFYVFSKDFPRRKLLSRWVRGGAYEQAFAETAAPASSSRLRYYNFSQIFQAADPEFAQAGIAAVLAQFNIEMLRADGKQLVLICDETPFFVKSCFDFFKFSTANVRKYGHAVVLISQLSSDFVVNGDTGIIDNSPQRFLFSIDGSEEAYAERLGLKPQQVESIKRLQSIPSVLSEAFFQSGDTGRKLKVRITPEEYWRLTTSRVDKEKLLSLMQHVPGLSLREAIACLIAV